MPPIWGDVSVMFHILTTAPAGCGWKARHRSRCRRYGPRHDLVHDLAAEATHGVLSTAVQPEQTSATLVSGAYSLDTAMAGPLFRSLPPVVHFSASRVRSNPALSAPVLPIRRTGPARSVPRLPDLLDVPCLCMTRGVGANVVRGPVVMGSGTHRFRWRLHACTARRGLSNESWGQGCGTLPRHLCAPLYATHGRAAARVLDAVADGARCTAIERRRDACGRSSAQVRAATPRSPWSAFGTAQLHRPARRGALDRAGLDRARRRASGNGHRHVPRCRPGIRQPVLPNCGFTAANSTGLRGWGSAGRALQSHCRGRGFEPLHLHQPSQSPKLRTRWGKGPISVRAANEEALAELKKKRAVNPFRQASRSGQSRCTML